MSTELFVMRFRDGPLAARVSTVASDGEGRGMLAVSEPEWSWPLPNRVVAVTPDAEGADALVVDAEMLPREVWPAPWTLYRKATDERGVWRRLEDGTVLRGALYRRVPDLAAMMWRLPELPWESPISVVRPDGSPGGYFCRLCIAREGLSVEAVIARGMSLGDAIAHIERKHKH